MSVDRKMCREILTGRDTFATTMLVLLLDHYGPELLMWAPQTIRMETEEDFGFKWPDNNFDRLMAAVAIVATDRFYKSLPDFIELCNVLSGAGVSPDVFDPADAVECAWGITEALLLDPPETDSPFAADICAYIGKVLDAEGILRAPDILRIADRDENKLLAAVTDFSEDPELYGAIWATENAKTTEITEITRSRLGALIEQLGALKLVNGTTAELARRMMSKLPPEKGSPM